MKLVNESCEVCGKRITEEDEIAQIITGKARAGAWRRLFFGIFKAGPRGIAWVHVDCADENIVYNVDNPHLTAEDIAVKISKLESWRPSK